LLILDSKWLYGTVLFFVLGDLIVKIPQLINSRIVFNQLAGNDIFQNALDYYSQTTFSEKIYLAIQSIHPLGLLDSMTFMRILFSLAALIIAFIIFYRKIKPLRTTSFFRKISLYSLSVFLLSILSGIVTYFFIKNDVVLMLSAVVGIISFTLLVTLLQTTIEALFISLLSLLLKREIFSIISLSEISAKFIKPLFAFNAITIFISGTFISNLIMFPDYIHKFIPDVLDYTVESLTGLMLNIGWFVAYFHLIFIIAFILTPIVISVTSHKKIIPILKESFIIIRRELNYFLSLIIWTLLVLSILITLSNLINPVHYEYPVMIDIIQVGIYNLLYVLTIMTFYVTAFKKILSLSKKY